MEHKISIFNQFIFEKLNVRLSFFCFSHECYFSIVKMFQIVVSNFGHRNPAEFFNVTNCQNQFCPFFFKKRFHDTTFTLFRQIKRFLTTRFVKNISAQKMKNLKKIMFFFSVYVYREDSLNFGELLNDNDHQGKKNTWNFIHNLISNHIRIDIFTDSCFPFEFHVSLFLEVS